MMPDKEKVRVGDVWIKPIGGYVYLLEVVAVFPKEPAYIGWLSCGFGDKASLSKEPSLLPWEIQTFQTIDAPDNGILLRRIGEK